MIAAFLPMLIQAGAGLMQGLGQKAQAKAQAKELQQNAVFLNRAANDAKRRGASEADWQRIQTQQAIGTQRAAQAANGGEINIGTNALIQQDTAQLGELDALTISNNAAREAYGYEVQAQQNLANAKTLKKNANKNLLTSILGGAVQGFGSSYAAGNFGNLFGSSTGAGTSAAMSANTTRLNNNQAYT